MRAEFGDDTDTADLDALPVGVWSTARWGSAAPSTFNRNLDAIRSVQKHWQDQQWMTTIDLTAALKRRKRAADRSRALTRVDLKRLLSREDVDIAAVRARTQPCAHVRSMIRV